MDARKRRLARLARHDGDAAMAEANRMTRRGLGPKPFTPREMSPFIHC